MNSGLPDPHLGKALAHAPDRDAAPPSHVSAQILAAAHREATTPSPAAPRTPAPWWRQPWGASGALATVLLAGFMGLLWRGEPPGPAVDGPATARIAKAPLPAAAPVTAPARAPVMSPVTAPAAVEPGSDTSRKAETPVLAQTARQRAEAPAKVAQAKEAARAADLQVARVAPPAAPAGNVAAESAAVAQTAMASPTVPAPAPMPATMPAAPPPTPAPAPVHVPPMAPTREAARALAVPAPAARTQMADSLVARPVQAVLPPLLSGDQLAWQPPSAAALPDAGWLQQLTALTRARWLSVEGAMSAGEAAPSALLTWQRGGAPLGVLRLEPGAVWWCAAGQTCLRALVPPDALRDLVGKLPGVR